MGKRHGGTIVPMANGKFRIALQWRGKRVWRTADTYEQAVDRLEQLKANRMRGRTDGLRAHTRRLRAEAWVVQLVEERDRQGWSPELFARVLVAQLSPRRIKRDIFGPCAYCGTWVAATIDHVIPQSMGGTDDPSNLVSACLRCNSQKGDRTTWDARIVARV